MKLCSAVFHSSSSCRNLSAGSMTESVIANAATVLQAKLAHHESEATSVSEASVKSPDRTFESERTSLAGDTDDASSYQTCNSGSASLSSTQMVTANSTLASVGGNSTMVTDESSALSDASTPRDDFNISIAVVLTRMAIQPSPKDDGLSVQSSSRMSLSWTLFMT